MNPYTLNNLADAQPMMLALSNPQRAKIMDWLLDPTEHFPPQRDGDLIEDGVCVGFITQKIALSQPTVTNHMKVLQSAGLVTSKKIKNWVFYKAQIDTLNRMSKVLRVISQPN